LERVTELERERERERERELGCSQGSWTEEASKENGICVNDAIVVAFSLFLPLAMLVARKRAHHSVRYLGLGFRVVLFLAFLALVRVVFRIQNDLVGGGSESSKETVFLVPKVAFLFLARSNLPLDFVWHTFFKVLVISVFFRCWN
jgi:hypothetical protein